ncbi:hypothetical protein DPMN_037999 [Dreissena polymorpha]|uniref:Uncharacterized protein n=1 Tax=Dreissena polymorpha TaxID=45954 RepID=A0A9D4MEF0_DREPO|nr:hypothetical protein DPMN_037999 [Dreissena polymorpha]
MLFPKPSGRRQETLRQSATMPKLSGHQPDTHRSLSDRWGICRDSNTVCVGAKTVWSAAGDSKTVCDVAKYVWAPAIDSQTVCDGAKTVLALAGDSLTVPDSLPDRRGTCRRFLNSLRRSERLSDTFTDCLGVS